MAHITSTNGYIVLVDDADLPTVQGAWHVVHKGNGRYYAIRQLRYTDADGKVRQRRVYLHRLLLPLSKCVDHINGDGLDNRRQNLRSSDKAQNAKNTTLKSTNSSGARGVSYRKDKRKWRAYIRVHGRQTGLGHYSTKEEAETAWLQYVKMSVPEDYYRYVGESLCQQSG